MERATSTADGFIEAVMKDEAGVRMKQADIHRQWHAHIDYCRQIGKHPIIVAPWGHGKTQQLVVGRVLYELGLNVNSRIGVVCNSDANAVKRVGAIKHYIERDPDYSEVFPGVRPDMGRGWGRQQIYVTRSEGARSIDPSVFSAGIFSTGIGGRMDGLVIDDPVDQRNALLQPKLRTAVIEALTSVWLSRLEPGGWLIYVATVWHPEDATHYLIRNHEVRGGYCALVQRVSDSYDGIDCYLVGGDESVAYPALGALAIEQAEGP